MALTLPKNETGMAGELVEIGPMDSHLHGPFFRFVRSVFIDIGFSLWSRRGGWDDRFVVFAIMEKGEIISTVGRTAMRLVIDGELIDGYQLASVATRKDRRHQGHLRRLMEHILSLPPLDDRPMILFGNPDVISFYPLFGFERIAQSRFLLRVDAGVRGGRGTRRLDMGRKADRDRLAAQCLQARPTSGDFSARDYEPILLWHLTYRPLSAIELPGGKATVILSHEAGQLIVHDVVAPAAFDLLAALKEASREPFTEIEFRFNPVEWLNEEAAASLQHAVIGVDPSPCFFRGRPRPQQSTIRFPELAQT